MKQIHRNILNMMLNLKEHYTLLDLEKAIYGFCYSKIDTNIGGYHHLQDMYKIGLLKKSVCKERWLLTDKAYTLLSENL